MNLYSIPTGNFKLDGGAMYGVVPKSIWQKLNPADENNLCNWAMRSLLIEDGNRLILIDNGIGDKQSDKFFSHYYLNGDDTLDKSLAAHGFHASDITDVILTHLHFDHCGGSVKREGDTLVTAFQNATYWSNAKHWQWATQPNEREKASFLKENILPIEAAGQLQFVDPGNSNTSLYRGPSGITENIDVFFVNGHTEAQMLPVIRYKDQTIVFAADLFPSAGHLPVPYVMAYDMFPLTTLQERKAFLPQALAGNFLLFFQHDPVVECCSLEQTERGIRQGKTGKLAEFI